MATSAAAAKVDHAASAELHVAGFTNHGHPAFLRMPLDRDPVFLPYGLFDAAPPDPMHVFGLGLCKHISTGSFGSLCGARRPHSASRGSRRLTSVWPQCRHL